MEREPGEVTPPETGRSAPRDPAPGDPPSADPICVCGHPLAGAVSPDGVTMPDGEYMRFRRRTDYLMCVECLRLYRVRDLGAGVVKPLSELDLLAD